MQAAVIRAVVNSASIDAFVAAVLFLRSEDASYVNGEAIVVDGGQLSGLWSYDDDAPPVAPLERPARRGP